ncbi:MAG: efflux RND transporter permease subunit [Rhodospirillales bacterium]
MDIIKIATRRPTAIVAVGLMIVILGFVAIRTIPIQLTPDVDKPLLQITSYWPGVSPLEVEREITNRIEQELVGVPGVTEIRGFAQLGRARVYLEFDINQDMDKAFTIVASRLNNIATELPEEATDPVIKTTDSDDQPVARLVIVRLPGNERDLESYGDFVDTIVTDRIERVSGVSQVSTAGGSLGELQVIIEPEQMAQYQLTVPNVLQALRQASVSATAGAVDEGKRRYLVRTDSEASTVERVREIVLKSIHDPVTGNIRRVRVSDVAKVEFGYKEPITNRRYLGQPAIRINVLRNPGQNVIEVIRNLDQALVELNEGMLKRQGLKVIKYYDETVYIKSAIDLVHQNIYVGGALAALILLLFLRSFGATLIVSFAIPLSVVGAFVAMAGLGRSINVISLAGIAFAVGMVVDAAIVVLENIYRHREMGKTRLQSAYDGAKQVWGAILASVLTTVVVFVPLLVLKLQAGQLFRDIAVAISVSVLLSLVVAITVIPALTSRLVGKEDSNDTWVKRRIPIVDDIAEKFVDGVLGLIRRIIRSKAASIGVVVFFCGVTAAATWLFLPPLDYLPDGNRNFVIGRLKPPPGYNLATTYTMAEQIEKELKPLWASVSGPDAKPNEPPKIDTFFFLVIRDMIFIGASAVDSSRAGELIPVIEKPVFKEPGMRGWVAQDSLFRRLGGARVINLDFVGPDLNQLLSVARRADELIRDVLPSREGTKVRPLPGLHLAAPEIRLTPDYVRLANANMTAREFAQTVNALNKGVKVLEINVGSRRMDLTLMGPRYNVKETQGISFLPVVLPSGTIVPVNSLATTKVTAGPEQIRHYNLTRAVRLQIKPAEKLPLETVINKINAEITGVLKKEGLPDDVGIVMSGASDSLSETWSGLKFNLIIAVLIVYLVMAILFESFVYPAIIMLSIPLATAGGIAGLGLLNTIKYQALDMMTMLGFVILIGIVVNNAILLVDQTLQHLRQEGMSPEDAIMTASHNRMRPIFMSTLTTVFGLMPLVLFAGAGSELYRGLGSVVLGGLTLSAILTLLIIPSLLSLFLRKAKVPKQQEEPLHVVATNAPQQEPPTRLAGE